MTILNQINYLSWHPFRRWSVRELTGINRIIIHQELGEANVEAVNHYHIRKNHISSRGCPHLCYHYGIEKNGEIIHANELNHITWHTRGQNDTGIGIMLAGNFAGPGHETGTTEPSLEQINSLEELCDYLIKAFGISNLDLYGHYHFGKPACPGYVVQNWIENRRKK
jgi:N-acetyl-anhydromuramyl-L-alanine amidase AmpD